ncbi:MAG: hypothetical protein AB8B50_20430 [Pirellulaceae bacterium]
MNSDRPQIVAVASPKASTSLDEPASNARNNAESNFSDMRKFRIVHLMWMSLSIAVGAAIYRWYPNIGVGMLVLASVFWLGCGLLLVSDTIDSRTIEDRGLVSQTLNAFGATMVAFSVGVGLALSLFCIFIGIAYLPSLWHKLAN